MCTAGSGFLLKLEAVSLTQPELGTDFERLDVLVDRDLGSDTLHMKILPTEGMRYEIPKSLYPDHGKAHFVDYVISARSPSNSYLRAVMSVPLLTLEGSTTFHKSKQLLVLQYRCGYGLHVQAGPSMKSKRV